MFTLMKHFVLYQNEEPKPDFSKLITWDSLLMLTGTFC